MIYSNANMGTLFQVFNVPANGWSMLARRPDSHREAVGEPPNPALQYVLCCSAFLFFLSFFLSQLNLIEALFQSCLFYYIF